MLRMDTYRNGDIQVPTIGLQRRTTVGQNKSGFWFAAGSMIMALVSLAFAPGVFGTLGIVLGMIAVVKGERYLGMLGVIASAVLAFTGYYVAGALIG